MAHPAEDVPSESIGWHLGFKEITSATNERTVIAAVLPAVAFGNKTPLLVGTGDHWPLAANFNSFAHDFVARQKVHGQTLNWFLVEQFPVVPPEAYDRVFGSITAEELVKDHILRLGYSFVPPNGSRQRAVRWSLIPKMRMSGGVPMRD